MVSIELCVYRNAIVNIVLTLHVLMLKAMFELCCVFRLFHVALLQSALFDGL